MIRDVYQKAQDKNMTIRAWTITLALCMTWWSYATLVDATRYVDIGCMYQMAGSLGPIGSTFPVVCNMWYKFWTEKPNGIGGLRIFPRMHYVDIGTTAASATNASNWLVARGVVAVGAPAGPTVANVALVLNKHQIGLYVGTISDGSIFLCEEPLAPPCLVADESRRFDWVLSLGTPATGYMQSFLNDVAVRVSPGLEKSISIITINRSTHTDVCVRGAIPLAQENGFIIKSINYIDYNATIENISQENKEMIAVLGRIKQEENPTAILFCHRYANDRLPQLLFNADYMPPAICSFEAASNVSEILQTVGSSALYISAPVQFDQRLVGPDYIEPPGRPYACMFPQASGANSQTSPRQFVTQYNAIPNAPPINALTGMALVQLEVIDFGIWACNCTTSAGIFNSASRVNMPTFAGRMAPDFVYGINSVKAIATVQLVQTAHLDLTNQTEAELQFNGVILPLAPDYALALTAPGGESVTAIVFPAPTFDERNYVHQMYAQTEERVVIVLVSLACLLMLAIARFLVRHRDSPSVKAASLPFSLLILFGAICACLSILTWPVENDHYTCSSRTIVMPLGFILFFAPLIAKSDRIANIFNVDKLVVKRYTHWYVFQVTLILIAMVMVPSILWSGIFPLELTIVVPDPLRPSLNYANCQSNNWIMAYITFFILTVILILAFIEAFRMRKITSKEFKESKSIATSIYMFTVLVTIAGLAQLGYGNVVTTLAQRRFLFLGRSIYPVAVVTSTIIFFWRQTYGVAFPSESSLIQGSTPEHTHHQTQSWSQARSPSPMPKEKTFKRQFLKDGHAGQHLTKTSLEIPLDEATQRDSTTSEESRTDKSSLTIIIDDAEVPITTASTSASSLAFTLASCPTSVGHADDLVNGQVTVVSTSTLACASSLASTSSSVANVSSLESSVTCSTSFDGTDGTTSTATAMHTMDSIRPESISTPTSTTIGCE